MSADRQTQSSAERRMWAVVRKMPPPVAACDLEQLAGVPEPEARLFLQGLADAGYLSRQGQGFALVRDTGPNPPGMLTASFLEDGNTGELHLAAEAPAGAGERIRDCLAKGRGGAVLSPVLVFLDRAGTFCLNDVAQQTGLDRRRLLVTLKKLQREGRIELVEDRRQESKGFREFGPAKRDPVWRVADRRPRPPAQAGRTGMDKVWRAVRSLRRFTRSQIAGLTGVKSKTVQNYLGVLTGQGFLRAAGTENRQQVYVLARDPGPSRPLARAPRNTKEAKS